MSERINARLSQPLAEFVDRMVGEAGLYHPARKAPFFRTGM